MNTVLFNFFNNKVIYTDKIRYQEFKFNSINNNFLYYYLIFII